MFLCGRFKDVFDGYVCFSSNGTARAAQRFLSHTQTHLVFRSSGCCTPLQQQDCNVKAHALSLNISNTDEPYLINSGNRATDCTGGGLNSLWKTSATGNVVSRRPC